MSALKPLDFQEATANRILELYQQKQYRVLLADEVGLGKRSSPARSSRR